MSLAAAALPLALVVAALGATRLASAAARTGERELPFGVRVIAGLALLTAVAGWLVLAGVYSRGAAYVLLGVAALGFFVRGGAREAASLAPPTAPESASLARWLWLAPIAVFVLVRGLGALRFPHYNPCDDFVAYLHFPRLLLESGSFDEPFGMRRLGVLGAGPFVQGFFWPGFGISANAVADATFGQLAILGGALATRDACARERRSSYATLAFVLVALLATLTIPYLNTLPVLLPYGGMLILLALHARSVTREPDASSARDAVLWGVLAAWLIGLRVSNALVPAALWAFELARAGMRRDRVRLRLSLIAGAATGLALLPWCLESWQSSGTPLFPLLAGNHRFPSVFTEPLTTRQLVKYVVECASANRAPVLVALAAVAFARREQRALSAQLAGAALLCLVATAISTTAFDSWTLLRYCAPLVVPVLLFLGALVGFAEPSPAFRWQRPALAALVAAWLLIPVTTHRVFDPVRFSLASFAHDDSREWIWAIRKTWNGGFALEDIPGQRPYEEAQRLLPADARVVSAAEQSYRWRYDRQTIHSLDCLGQASPEPGMPFFKGAEAVAEYFAALGYTHLAFTPPRASLCLYSAKHWQMDLHKGQWMWRQWAPLFLDFMQTQRALAQTREVVYRSPTLVVVDLRERVTSAPPAP